jgi:hypothetical protein
VSFAEILFGLVTWTLLVMAVTEAVLIVAEKTQTVAHWLRWRLR